VCLFESPDSLLKFAPMHTVLAILVLFASMSNAQTSKNPVVGSGTSGEHTEQNQPSDRVYKVDVVTPATRPLDTPLFPVYLWITATGVAVNALIWFLIFWQTKLSRHLIRVNLIAAKAAVRSARATKKAADAASASGEISRLAMIAGERAYVYHDGFSLISHLDKKKGEVFWRITPRWVNSGNTPARNLEVYSGCELRDSPLPDDFPFAVPLDLKEIRATIRPKGETGGIHSDIFGKDIAAVGAGRKFLYFWGVAKYRDVFPGTPLRITKYCTFSANVMGDPLKPFDDPSNNVGMGFITYHKHNCADEDCVDSLSTNTRS
jgi:hypothetical protein